MTRKRFGIPVAQARLLHVYAAFPERSRVALDSDWPLLLDGLLAGVIERRKPSPKPITHDLPLARYTESLEAQWSWLASVGSPLEASPEWAQRWEGEPRVITVDCLGAEWYCVGHAEGVRSLLCEVHQIGNRRQAARVAQWAVVDVGPVPTQIGEPLWLPSGYIARPIAARGAAALGVLNADTVDGAIRPPYWRPPSITEGGKFERQWRPVIAPWTRKPEEPGPE